MQMRTKTEFGDIYLMNQTLHFTHALLKERGGGGGHHVTIKVLIH